MSIYGKISYRYKENIDYTLENIEPVVNSNSRIGIVGTNGAGKSTLIKVISGELIPEGVFRNDYLTAVLDQESDVNSLTGLHQVYKNNKELLTLREDIENFTGNDLDIFTRYQDLGGWELEASIDKWLNRFELKCEDLKRPLSSLSGGEKTKIRLIALLIEDPELIILDEPTNNLDTLALDWLENFLCGLTIPYILISHDRWFLDKTISTIWEIKNGGLTIFPGNYSNYKKAVEEKFNRDMHLYIEQSKKITKLNHALNERRKWSFSYQGQTGSNGYAPIYEEVTNKSKEAMKRAKNIEKRINMIIEKEEKKRPDLAEPPRIVFSKEISNSGKKAISCKNVSKKYNKVLFNSLDLVISHGERVCLTGSNGSGKTTLIKCILGLESLDSGVVFIPEGMSVAYFSQEYVMPDLKISILDEVTNGDLTNQSNVRKSLASIGFRGDDVFRCISTLSPGERSKVSLIKTMLAESDILILDEPTNHLEIDTMEVIEDALINFKGTVLFVSHDRMFREKVSTRTVTLF